MRLSNRIRPFTVGVVVLLAANFARAQAPPATCTDWIGVQSWTGTITVSGAGQSADQYGNTFTVSEQASIHFTAPSNSGNSCGPNTGQSWVALGSQAAYSVNVHDVENTTCIDTKNPLTVDPEVVHVDISNGSSSTGSAGLRMDFGQTTPTYSVGVGEVVDGTVHSTPGNPACNAPPSSWTDPQDGWGPGALLLTPSPTSTPLPATVSPLIGSAKFQSAGGPLVAPNATWTVSWNIAPAPPDVDVVVATAPDYATWRPTAGRNETDPGANLLLIKAQLVKKGTNQLATGVIPDKWSFSLIDVSHEPGVALNWPSMVDRANPSPPDMTFNKQINSAINPNLTITDNDRLAEILNPSQTSSPQNAEVLLVPFDWGGWATLNVTATVLGNPIKGHIQLPDGSSATDILLPLRQSNSFIADQWKVDHGATALADADDSEDSPAGNGQNGDGLTLYEEYRGFYMGCALSNLPVLPEGAPGAVCKHVEGDPHVKDLFVVSYLSAAQNIGIQKFRDITGLNVHYRGLSQLEVDQNRLVNFNFGQGPHLQNANTVGQHALYIHWEAGLDASTVLGGPGLPRQVEQILISALPQLLEPAPGPSPGDNEFTHTVAHELSHAVSVFHHGEGDTGDVYWYADANGQVWETKTSGATGATGGVPIRVFYEPEDPNTVTPLSPLGLGLLTDCCLPSDNNCDPSKCPPKPGGIPQHVGNRACSSGTVVTLGHQHSGDVNCVMRYPVASAYIPLGYPDVRYYLWGFADHEVRGYFLTDTTTGTGVNDKTAHSTGLGPLSRYGAAYGAAYGDSNTNNQRGNCSDQIDVNDLHASLSRGLVLCPAPPQ